jgi:hypothetical protein
VFEFNVQLGVASPAKARGVVLKPQEFRKHYPMLTLNLRESILYVMVGSSFNILSETPFSDPHAGFVGAGG